MKKFDYIDKKLLNILQSDFPIVEKPFEDIAVSLNTTEKDVIQRIRLLKYENKIIRQIGPVFNTNILGYKRSLAAFKVDEEDIDRVAEIVNRHPGVSHNYKRDCEYNLWFTVAVPPEDNLENSFKRLAELLLVTDYMFLPVLKEYKIDVKFDLENTDDYNENSNTLTKDKNEKIEVGRLTDKDVDFIRVLQGDLDLVSQPFKMIADKINLSQAELIDLINRFLKNKRMRRFAAVLNHRSAGFLSNAMVVWNVDEDNIDEYGKIISSFKSVSHCYRRPVYPNWQYSLYSMIHATDKEKCEEIIGYIAKEIECNDYRTAYSVKEYKKKRIKYFTEK